jgi:hypothetical protein
MNNIKLPLFAAALVAVCTGPALAMPFSDLYGQDQSLKQDVRVICHHGRCYETRRAARYYYGEEPYYAPRAYDYYGGPGYGYYGGGPGIGFSFGFGGHHRGW